MPYELILAEVRGRVGLVTLNRPQAMNALNNQLMRELMDALAAFDKDETVGVMVITGNEKGFAAGADIKEMVDQSIQQIMDRDHVAVFGRIRTIQKPVIAAVSGWALGGGCEIALSCDMIVASESAKFGQPEVNLGLIPGYGGTQRLIQYVGKTKAMELLMTADMLGAAEALQLGLVNYVVPAGEEVLKAKELIEKIATKAPLAISKIIETVNTYFEAGEDGFWKEVDAFGECCGTEDFLEGAAAFVEKRKANFKGK